MGSKNEGNGASGKKIISKTVKKPLMAVLIVVVVIMLVAGSYLAVVDGIKDIVTTVVAKISDVLSDGAIERWLDNSWNAVKNLLAPGSSSYTLPDGDTYVMRINDDQFNTIKSELDNIINLKASGYTDLVIKKMLLTYYTSVCTSDTMIVIALTDEEAEEYELENNGIPEDEQAYQIKTKNEIDDLMGATEEDTENGSDKYLVTKGIVHFYYIDGNKKEELRYIANGEKNKNINDLLAHISKYANIADTATGRFYTIEEFGTITVYGLDYSSTKTDFKYNRGEHEIIAEKEEDPVVTLNNSDAKYKHKFQYTDYTTDYVIPVQFLVDLLDLTGSPEFIDKFAKLQEDSYINVGIYKTQVTTTTHTTKNYDYELTLNGTYTARIPDTYNGSTGGLDAIYEAYEKSQFDPAQGFIYDSTVPRIPTSETTYKEEEKNVTHKVKGTQTTEDITTTIEEEFQMDLFEVENWYLYLSKNNTTVDTTTYTYLKPDGSYSEETDQISLPLTPITEKETGTDPDLNIDGNKVVESTTIRGEIVETAIEDAKDRKILETTWGQIVKGEDITWKKAHTEKGKIDKTVYKEITSTELLVGTSQIDDRTDKFLALLSNKDGKYDRNVVKEGKFVSKAAGGQVVKYNDIYDSKVGAGEMLENGAEVLFELLEENLDQNNNELTAGGSPTEGLVEIMKYIMWRYSGTDYGVTSFSMIGFINASLSPFGMDYIVKTDVGDSKLVITDIDTLKKAFGGYQTNSKLLAEAQTFLDMQEKYKVNAIFAAAVSITETTAGTAGKYAINGHNWFNYVPAGDVTSCDGYLGRMTNSDGAQTYCKWDTDAHGIMGFGSYIATHKNLYFNKGEYTVSAIGSHYCPNDTKHPNQSENWIRSVQSYMGQMYAAAGIEVGFTSGNGDFLSTAKQCHDYLATHGFVYHQGNEIKDFLNNKQVDCSTYVTWVLYEYGYTELEGHQKTSNWYADTNSWKNYANSGKWQKVAKKDVQAGDILCKNGHVEIYAGENNILSCGSNEGIRQEYVTYANVRGRINEFDFAIRVLKRGDQ